MIFPSIPGSSKKKPTRILKPNSSKHQDTPDFHVFFQTLSLPKNLGNFYLNIGDSSFVFKREEIGATTKPIVAGSATESFRRSDFGRKDAPQCCRRTFEDFGGATKSMGVKRLTPPFSRKIMEGSGKWIPKCKGSPIIHGSVDKEPEMKGNECWRDPIFSTDP